VVAGRRLFGVAAVGRLPVLSGLYALALLTAHLWLAVQTPAQRSADLDGVSTSVAHLASAPWLVLPASALFPDRDALFWLPVALICVGALELTRGPVVTAIVGGLAHLVGTGLSEAVVAVRIAAGNLPGSAAHLLDIGPSYVVLGCAMAAVSSTETPRWARRACAAVLLIVVPAALAISDSTQVARIGHLVAMVVGLLAARVLRPLGRGAREALTHVVDTPAAVAQR
jgi:hypothetical protein